MATGWAQVHMCLCRTHTDMHMRMHLHMFTERCELVGARLRARMRRCHLQCRVVVVRLPVLTNQGLRVCVWPMIASML